MGSKSRKRKVSLAHTITLRNSPFRACDVKYTMVLQSHSDGEEQVTIATPIGGAHSMSIFVFEHTRK